MPACRKRAFTTPADPTARVLDSQSMDPQRGALSRKSKGVGAPRATRARGAVPRLETVRK